MDKRHNKKKYGNILLLTMFFVIFIAGCNTVVTTTPVVVTVACPPVPTPEKCVVIEPTATTAATFTPQQPTATPLPPGTAKLASVQLLDIPTQPEDFNRQSLLDDAINYGLDLRINGIYAFDKNTALLYGHIRAFSQTFQSTVLRTDDGGLHWMEVMNPVLGSEVEYVSFLDDGTGWALIMWTNESQGLVVLYQTKDYGKTWYKLSDIPKSDWFGVPWRMEFQDSLNGQIDMMYLIMSLYNRVEFLETSDGGITWETGHVLKLSNDNHAGHGAITAPYDYLYPRTKQNVSKDNDGGFWTFRQEMIGTDSSYIIVARQTELTVFDIPKYALPTHFVIEDGKVRTP